MRGYAHNTAEIPQEMIRAHASVLCEICPNNGPSYAPIA